MALKDKSEIKSGVKEREECVGAMCHEGTGKTQILRVKETGFSN
jgi:hypothetical protein